MKPPFYELYISFDNPTFVQVNALHFGIEASVFYKKHFVARIRFPRLELNSGHNAHFKIEIETSEWIMHVIEKIANGDKVKLVLDQIQLVSSTASVDWLQSILSPLSTKLEIQYIGTR